MSLEMSDEDRSRLSELEAELKALAEQAQALLRRFRGVREMAAKVGKGTGRRDDVARLHVIAGELEEAERRIERVRGRLLEADDQPSA
jgi:hypothetical protein